MAKDDENDSEKGFFKFRGKKNGNEEEKETDIYEISRKSSFRDGKDRLGTLVGSYDKGLVIGNYYFPYENMKSISKSKDEEIMIKGREDSKNYIIKIGSLNSANQTIIELNNALNEGKIDEKKINLKKIKNFQENIDKNALMHYTIGKLAEENKLVTKKR